MAKLAGNFAAQRSQHNARVPRKAFKDMLDIVGPRGHDFIPNSSILKAAVGGHHCDASAIFIFWMSLRNALRF